MEIGERLAAFAEAQFEGNISAFARAIDMNHKLLRKYVDGTSKPGAEILAQFQSAGLSIDWLLSGEGAMLVVDGRNAAVEAGKPLGPVRRIDLLRQIADELEFELTAMESGVYPAHKIMQFYDDMQDKMSDEEKADRARLDIERENEENDRASKN